VNSGRETAERLHEVASWTTSQVLAYQAETRSNEQALEFVGGATLTYREIWDRTKAISAGLLKQGLLPGDKVAVLLPNSVEFCEIWFGCHQAGCVLVPLNIELVGSYLSYAINTSEARMLVVDEALLPQVERVTANIPDVEKVVLVSNRGMRTTSVRQRIVDFEDLRQSSDDAPESFSRFNDLACLMFTSGTTGPSKAVMMPHGHCYLLGLGTVDNLELSSNDIYYVSLPMFHANAMFMQVYASLIAGAKAVIRQKFSASEWISDIKKYKATHTNFLGVMAEFIWQQPRSSSDKDHDLRVICAVPAAPVYIQRFSERFGVSAMVEVYGMSEVNIPLWSQPGDSKPGSCGRVYDRYFDVRIADPDDDQLLPCGAQGEIQVRPKQAFGFMSGYYNSPEKTVEAWRNLWFHSGDVGYVDSEGYFYFEDRIKDRIRRRGENISSYEIESSILDFPGVTECAVVAVRSEIEGGEDEVMAVVVADGAINKEDLLDYCKEHIPRFAVPNFFRFCAPSDIPRTSTNKIIKNNLRETGVTPDTWRVGRVR
jgi:crotonobetaine/carnitine-CoA ligase